ncbi:hypothetical protein KKD52_16505 [Myxococcota bacterium]|nr:hypothetical protein [Myxococcota bacterium]
MKKLFLASFTLFVLAFSTAASAQIIILEGVPGDGCSMGLSSPCAPAPAPAPVVYQRPVVRSRYAPPPVVAAPATTLPPPPVGLPRYAQAQWFPRWGINVIYSVSGDSYGTLIGGGMNLEYMFSRHFGIEGSILGMGEAEEDVYATTHRSGARFGASLMWFPGGLKTNGSSFYLRGGVVGQTIDTYDDYSSTYEPIYTKDTSFREVAAGLRYTFELIPQFYAMSLGVEASVLFDTDASNNDYDDGSSDESTAAFRLTFGFHF